MDYEAPAKALARAQRWLRNVTNRELSKLDFARLPFSAGERRLAEAEDIEPSMEMVFSSNRGYRYDLEDATRLIRRDAIDAAERDPSTCPYADPVFGQGFR